MMTKGHNSLRQSVMGCLRHFTKVLPLALVAVVSSACSGQDDFIDNPTTSENKVQITFSLQFDQATTTRASVVDPTNPDNSSDSHDKADATEIERTVNNMQVLLFGSDGKCMGEFIESTNPAFDGHTFYGWIAREKIDDRDATENTPINFSGKLVVLANFPESSRFQADTNKSLSDLQNVLYTYNSTFTSQFLGTSPTDYIPMWAVKELKNEVLTPGVYHNVGEVDLLRAMAKIQINVDKESFERSGYELTSATLSKYNSNGHVVPTGYTDAANTAALNQDNALNIDQSINAGSGTLSFSKTTDLTWSLYTPELKNKDVTDHATIHLVVTKKDAATITDSYELQIGKYAEKASAKKDNPTEYYDLVRNHIYTYTLYMDKGVKLKLEVRKYNLRSHNTVYM